MTHRVALILSGCGVFDGTEIHEAVSFLIALDEAGCHVTCAAPNLAQMHTVNHRTGQPEGPARNVLAESARIARGRIVDLAELKPAELDAAVFPGGFGAAKNLSDFATAGAACTVQPHVAAFITAMHAAARPIVLACIAPVLAARVLGAAGRNPTITIGQDPATATAVADMHATHQPCDVTGLCVDRANRLITTPCYMLQASPAIILAAARKAVAALVAMLTHA